MEASAHIRVFNFAEAKLNSYDFPGGKVMMPAELAVMNDCVVL